nr:immunoglobulin heavy chain junction region [Macaca mulatta]MOV53626.1 immunoglobulin heavy chain junction region [Macaca mulatta]MOV55650.1 immunoglobulin heavy chain junction region [Macaca mulatta]MOV56508.1 immunoglobulin heavy chain junction region [Macaca mulatta]MOV57863.1 immunoglobulin heavy chain junction region [Macaca mulatta]
CASDRPFWNDFSPALEVW